MNKASVTKIRDEILEAALPVAVKQGWTLETLNEAAKKVGHSPQKLRAAFPGGVGDALSHFADMADRGMLQNLKKIDIDYLRAHERVRAALIARYKWLAPRKDAFRASLSFWASPFHKARAGKIVWRTADRIWDYAGDEATDYNRYTKRALLSGIIAASTLAWMNDQDVENMDDLKAFIDRRMENVMQLNKGIGFIKGIIQKRAS